ncbi:MAG: hypothetical protein HY722_07565 [Planctomycetes bacterium]|nr:hypothetical protein [Planctomycetota bacterium]
MGAAEKGGEARAGILKAVLLLDSLAPEVVQGLRTILSVRAKGDAAYVNLPEVVRALDPAALRELVAGSSAEEAAAVLAVLEPEAGAVFLDLLGPEAAAPVVAAAARLDRLSVLNVLRAMERRLVRLHVRSEMVVGVPQVVAVLSRADDRVAQAALLALGAVDAALAEAVRREVYLLEDLSLVPEKELAEFLRMEPERPLAAVLAGLAAAQRRRVLASLPRGKREVVEKEVEFAVRLPEAERARERRGFLDRLADSLGSRRELLARLGKKP